MKKLNEQQTVLLWKVLIGIVITVSIMYLSYIMGVVNSDVEKPLDNQNNFFWDDDNCFSVNSVVKTQKNLDENGELFYTVIVTSEYDRQFIECYTDEIATAKEHKDALIMSLKDGIR